MRYLLVCLVSWVFLAIGQAHASDSSVCKTLYRKKQFTRAAQCFFDLAKVWEKKRPQTGQSRSKAGGFLRNASLCYRKAAKREKVVHKQAFLRERAMMYIKRILSRKLYEAPSQKRLATHIKDKLEEAIGYVQVTVVTNSPTAKGKVTGGYRYSGVVWKGLTKVLKLRPGAYTVVVDFGGKASKVKVLKVKSGQAPTVLQMKWKPKERVKPRVVARVIPVPRRVAPLPKPKSNVVPWVLVGLGGAALVAGAIVTGLAFSTKGSADAQISALRQSNTSTLQDTRTITEGYSNANTQLAIGMACGGVGVTSIGVGVILMAVR